MVGEAVAWQDNRIMLIEGGHGHTRLPARPCATTTTPTLSADESRVMGVYRKGMVY